MGRESLFGQEREEGYLEKVRKWGIHHLERRRPFQSGSAPRPGKSSLTPRRQGKTVPPLLTGSYGPFSDQFRC